MLKFSYDEESDCLYAYLGTKEPSISHEISDFIVVDRGMFSGRVTGFEIIGVKAWINYERRNDARTLRGLRSH